MLESGELRGLEDPKEVWLFSGVKDDYINYRYQTFYNSIREPGLKDMIPVSFYLLT